MEMEVIPIVIGVLGTIPARERYQLGNETSLERYQDNLKEIEIPVKASQIQKSVSLGIARILRKVLEV